MTHPPNSRQGYARKQARPSFDFLQETRSCIKTYTETELPQKRPNPESNRDTPLKDLDRYSQYTDELNSLFSPNKFALQASSFNDSLEPEPILEVPVQTTAEVLKNFVIELDKACKLTGSQLKVLEKYGVEWNSDPWKFEPRYQRFTNQFRSNERGGYGDKRRDGRRFKHRHSLTRIVRKFDEVNIEEIQNDLPIQFKTWNITKGFILKKLICEVSIKKDIIAQSRNFS